MNTDKIVYQPLWMFTVMMELVFTVLTLLWVQKFIRFFSEPQPTDETKTIVLTGVLIGVWFIGMLATGIALWFSVRRVTLIGDTIRIEFLLKRGCEMKRTDLQQLQIRAFQQSHRGRDTSFYRITFITPEGKKIWFAMDGDKGEQIAQELKKHITS